MRTTPITTSRRIALYDCYRDRREAYQKKAYQELGGRCVHCGSTAELRHRFIDLGHPLSSRYKTNPVTLYRKICNVPSVRSAVCLVCRECRVAHCSIGQPIENAATPGYKPLPQSHPLEGTNEK